MSALPLTPARFNKLWIPFLNHLLVGDLCKSSFDYHILSFFLVLYHDFVIYIDFTHVAASDMQMMTSQIRSHIEYLIHTNNILVLILYSKLMRNVAEMAIFNTI